MNPTFPLCIVGQVYTPLFYINLPPFSKISRNPRCLSLFTGLSGKQRYWMTLLTNLYIISSLKASKFWKNIYESGKMQTWYNVFKCFLVKLWKVGVIERNKKLLPETITYIIATERSTNITVTESTTCIIATELQNLDNCNRRCHLHNCYRKYQLHSSNRNCHRQNWLQKLTCINDASQRYF